MGKISEDAYLYQKVLESDKIVESEGEIELPNGIRMDDIEKYIPEDKLDELKKGNIENILPDGTLMYYLKEKLIKDSIDNCNFCYIINLYLKTALIMNQCNYFGRMSFDNDDPIYEVLEYYGSSAKDLCVCIAEEFENKYGSEEKKVFFKPLDAQINLAFRMIKREIYDNPQNLQESDINKPNIMK